MSKTIDRRREVFIARMRRNAAVDCPFGFEKNKRDKRSIKEFIRDLMLYHRMSKEDAISETKLRIMEANAPVLERTKACPKCHMGERMDSEGNYHDCGYCDRTGLVPDEGDM